MTIVVRQAAPADAPLIEEMLLEAARWVDALGVVMWDEGELVRDAIQWDVNAGMYFIAEAHGEPAGMVRFQLEDRMFWPDLEGDDSAFVHRLVARRSFKGQGISACELLEPALALYRATNCEIRPQTLSSTRPAPRVSRRLGDSRVGSQRRGQAPSPVLV